jgi:hypothetical protein
MADGDSSSSRKRRRRRRRRRTRGNSSKMSAVTPDPGAGLLSIRVQERVHCLGSEHSRKADMCKGDC